MVLSDVSADYEMLRRGDKEKSPRFPASFFVRYEFRDFFGTPAVLLFSLLNGRRQVS